MADWWRRRSGLDQAYEERLMAAVVVSGERVAGYEAALRSSTACGVRSPWFGTAEKMSEASRCLGCALWRQGDGDGSAVGWRLSAPSSRRKLRKATLS
ncbi:hypothetical protein L1887_59557 [Cichorium endivia]|nr:hypothetical protein L1887_59557 [Cichorium endivia]